MGITSEKLVEYLIVDTTAFIQNAPLQEVAANIITCPEVVSEITNKRQLRRLVVLPYDLIVKEAFPEYVQLITEFAKKTGDYPSLSATDIKLMALTYQMQKEKEGIENLRKEPVLQKPTITTENKVDVHADVTGFFLPRKSSESKDINMNKNEENPEAISELAEKLDIADQNNKSVVDDTDKLYAKVQDLDCNADNNQEETVDDILVPVCEDSDRECESEDDEDDDDDSGWITPSNVQVAKKQVNSELMEEKHVTVSCMTTDFAMQNVLRQINLNVSALDGRQIKQLRTYVLRCYTCFKTTSIMTKKFCPKCGNNTLKKVAVSLDADGKMQIHINPRRPLTGRGKKFSLPRIKGGKHPNNPILVDDQPMPDNKPTRLARMKNNPLDDDYIAGVSPFLARDVTSKSAQLGIRPGQEFKYWMRKNPNEARRKRK